MNRAQTKLHAPQVSITKLLKDDSDLGTTAYTFWLAFTSCACYLSLRLQPFYFTGWLHYPFFSIHGRFHFLITYYYLINVLLTNSCVCGWDRWNCYLLVLEELRPEL